MSCSACGSALCSFPHVHPLLQIPICDRCDRRYHRGEFAIEDGNEVFCRWCGEGEGGLILCDNCPKAFCVGCIQRNFGDVEVNRIQNLQNGWNCLICSPQPFFNLCEANGWKAAVPQQLPTVVPPRKLVPRKNTMIHADICQGREKFDIPAYNEVDKAKLTFDFDYVIAPVCCDGVKLTNNPENVSCCSCIGICVDPTECECLQKTGGQAYDVYGKLLRDRVAGTFECNQFCACNANQCTNRVVTNGPQLPLEVFRCANTAKGWGVRCRADIDIGTYVADYIGEILPEAETEHRGLTLGDEYLFSLDTWGRICAADRLKQLGLNRKPQLYPNSRTDADVSIANLTYDDLVQYLGSDIADLLRDKGAYKSRP